MDVFYESVGTLIVVNKTDIGDLPCGDFFRWRVPELKEYLRSRGFKTTDRKVELVLLAYGPNQLGVNKERS